MVTNNSDRGEGRVIREKRAMERSNMSCLSSLMIMRALGSETGQLIKNQGDSHESGVGFRDMAPSYFSRPTGGVRNNQKQPEINVICKN